MGTILEQFGIQPILLLAQIVNFFVLLYILNKLLYKPILNVLKQRKDKIEEGLKNAEEIERKLAQTEEEKEKALEKAALEAKKIVENASKSANEIIADAHAKAKEDMEGILEKGREALSLERERLNKEMRGELSNIVSIALEKVAGKAIKEKEQKILVDDAVKGM